MCDGEFWRDQGDNLMPIHVVGPSEIEFSRRSIILDTNILLPYFDRHDSKHPEYKYLIDEFLPDCFDQYLVPEAVLVETWGQLVRSKNARHEVGMSLIDWVRNPGSCASLIPDLHTVLDQCYGLSRERKVDVVDSIIMQLANTLSVEHSISPSLVIATLDGDFVRCRYERELSFRIYNPETNDLLG